MLGLSKRNSRTKIAWLSLALQPEIRMQKSCIQICFQVLLKCRKRSAAIELGAIYRTITMVKKHLYFQIVNSITKSSYF